MSFEEAQCENCKTTEKALDLAIRTGKLQKDKFDLERTEMVERLRAYKREIDWLTERSLLTVLGVWLWKKIANNEERKRHYERYF
jgi:hypothetical protein